MRLLILAVTCSLSLAGEIWQMFPWTRVAPTSTVTPVVTQDFVTVGTVIPTTIAPGFISVPAPGVSVHGTPGSSTWSYAVVACDLIGCSAPSANTTVANGAAVLSGTNFNRIATVAVIGSTSRARSK